MLDLPAIRKQAEAAGDPWVLFFDEGHGYGVASGDWEIKGIPFEAAQFIAAARTNVPALVAALEEAQKKLDAIQEAAALGPDVPASEILRILKEEK